ncbi:nitroreductase family protein [Flavihumibacter profundi]|jgi:nitroreductase / dihydropteridine reductase|uniref:nitroreductase family protein n=1 Tax=Flavihumibacter profundi TaxID=2716883 RepID=UPI001CC4EA85|nr:nitroreductase family protein [Flavihumibacter profundi]MBZ5858639.1 nitroreductase family protein [Flavihumibacter profundi]
MNYLQDLNWRYAVKRMNGNKVPTSKMNNILEAIRLAPTSLGLQPFDVLVIEDQELREKMSPAIYNQPQVIEGAALLVFAAWKNVSEEKVEQYMQNIANTRNSDVASLDGFKNMILDSLKVKTPSEIFQWNARQAYIALGYATAAAAFEKVDSTPMEGFSVDAVNQILSLEEKGLSAVSILAIGYRDEEKDFLANAPKVRRPAESFFTLYENTAEVA